MVKNSSNSNFTSLLGCYCDISIGYPERPIAAILDVTNLLPQVRNAPYTNSISPVFQGIPQNLDSPKRAVAQYILSKLSKYHDI